jgi:ubiquinone/menaquinone biosynthesis C-methylase UbiE
MPASGFDRMARWRDLRMGDRGDLWHRTIIDPALLDVVGRVRGQDVLEIACGNGYLTRRFARSGARSVLGIDLSRPTIARARARSRAGPRTVRFAVGDAAHLPQLPGRSFDLIVANMALMDIEDGGGAIREVGRLLRAEGRFVFSINHPCFDTDVDSMWVVERGLAATGALTTTVWRKVSRYRDERRKSVPWDVTEEHRTEWTDAYQRTLSTYARHLRAAGLAITRMEEPVPLPEALRKSPQAAYIAEIPLHLVVEAKLLRPAPRARSPVRPGSRSSGRSRGPGPRRSGSGGRRRGSGSARPSSSAGS